MKAPTLTIIRTAVGSPSVAGLIQELQKRNVRVIGTDCNSLSVGFFLCNKGYVVLKAEAPLFLKKFLEICDKEKVNAVISGPEEEVLVLSKHRKVFEERNILLLIPDFQTAKLCADKLATHQFFEREDIPMPKLFSEKKVEFPCMIKPRFGRGGVNVYKVEDEEELSFLKRKVQNPIFQEFVEGVEYTVDIFSDLEGSPLSIVPRVRIQVESGISMKGKTVYDRELIEWCEKIARTLRLLGPSCVQCIRGKQGLKFIEVNTRFGGGSILSIKADHTIVPNLIRIIQGKKPIKSKGFQGGLTMLRFYGEVYTHDS